MNNSTNYIFNVNNNDKEKASFIIRYLFGRPVQIIYNRTINRGIQSQICDICDIVGLTPFSLFF